MAFNPEDLIRWEELSNSLQERLRNIEIYGFDKDGKPILLYKDQFFLEGSGYYVKPLF